MKKNIISSMLIVILIMSNMVISFASVEEIDEFSSFKSALKKIEKVSDKEFQDSVKDLYLLNVMVAYYELETTDQLQSIESERKSEAKLNDVDSVVKMSIKEINKEITELIIDVIAKESSNDNIVWDENFVNTYVKKYAPDQISNLKVVGQNNRLISDVLGKENMDLSAAALNATVKTTSYGRNTRGDSLFRLITTTTFGYDGTRVLSLYPSTTHKIDNSVWEFVGLDPLSGETIEYSASRGSYIGVVKKFGDFRIKVLHTPGTADLMQWCYEDGTYSHMYTE